MQGKKNAQIRAKYAPNTTLQKLCREKKMHNLEPKKHITLPCKNYAKRKKYSQIRAKKGYHTTLEKKPMPRKKNSQIRAKKAPNTTLQKLFQEEKNCTNSS